MFTGIVEEAGVIEKIKPTARSIEMTVRASVCGKDVKVGDSVSAGQTVLIVEAMKTMNPIAAPKGGRVARIMIENQQPVEFGQPLLIIE